MKSGHLTLRKKMLLALLASFLPMLLAITLLFDRSIRVQHRAHVQAISYTAQDISKTLDRFTEGVYSVSDAFSTDERLLEILDRSYSDNPNAKKYAITYANGALFESYSRLVKQKKIDAIYAVNRHDVLDFLDPNQTTTLLIKNFEALEMDDARKFGKFYFYPLQENFLRTERYGEVRRDQVVLGSRRVYSALKSGYPYIMVPTYKATDDIPAEQFKAAWFDADRKVLSEKVVGTADTTISQIWTSEAPLYGMGQQDLDTTMKNIFSRSNEAIKEAELY